jgi:hypothetical protein
VVVGAGLFSKKITAGWWLLCSERKVYWWMISQTLLANRVAMSVEILPTVNGHPMVGDSIVQPILC